MPVGWIGELVERKVRRLQLMVRAAKIDRPVRVVGTARIQLVDRARIGTGAEVARPARLHAVAPHLHVPEERLPQRDGDVAVADVGAPRFVGSGTGIPFRLPGPGL